MTRYWMLGTVLVLQVAASCAAHAQTPVLPSPLCLRPGEHASPYGPFPSLADYPDYDSELTTLTAECRLYAVEGVCSDGRRLLVSGTGFTNSIKLYTAQGEFQSLVWQTDVQSAPCWGQGAWPRYEYCEAPTITRHVCGMPLPPNAPAFSDWWAP